MFSRTSRRVAITAVAGGIVVAAWWVSNRLVWRDQSYRLLVQGFQQARPVEERSSDTRAGALPDRWYEVVKLENGVGATIEAPDSPSPRATVTFSDDSDVYDLYPPEDYTTLIAVRTDGTAVFVLRNIELLSKTQRLSRFDLKSRELTADRRIDPVDVPEVP